MQWPLLVAAIVFVGLAFLPLGPWYVSGLLLVGVSLCAKTFAAKMKTRLGRTIRAKSKRHPRFGPLATKDAVTGI